MGHLLAYAIPENDLIELLGNAGIPSGAKAREGFGCFMYGLKPVPFIYSPYTRLALYAVARLCSRSPTLMLRTFEQPGSCMVTP
jgi:hypothetical protein